MEIYEVNLRIQFQHRKIRTRQNLVFGHISGSVSVRADHPSNTKLGGVPLYYKSFLPIKLIDVNYLNECISFELRIGGKVCKFLSVYRLPSQNKDEFERFLDNLKVNFDHMADKNPYLIDGCSW